jgi:hypothetical protein
LEFCKRWGPSDPRGPHAARPTGAFPTPLLILFISASRCTLQSRKRDLCLDGTVSVPKYRRLKRVGSFLAFSGFVIRHFANSQGHPKNKNSDPSKVSRQLSQVFEPRRMMYKVLKGKKQASHITVFLQRKNNLGNTKTLFRGGGALISRGFSLFVGDFGT